MDELIDILDAQGNSTGQICLKSEAHRKGLFHPTVHVWFYSPEGQILFQKRVKNKDTFPSLWDVSVAGHINSGEEISEATLREIKEEIGLLINAVDLEKIGVFKSSHTHATLFVDNEFHHTYLSQLQVPIHHLKKQESEVEDLQLFDLNFFKEKLEQNNFAGFVPHPSSYYETVIAEIEKRISC